MRVGLFLKNRKIGKWSENREIPDLWGRVDRYVYQWSSFKLCICICTNYVSLGVVNGQIMIIYYKVMALANVQKMDFGF